MKYFKLRWDIIIKKDIEFHYNRALKSYVDNIDNFNEVLEQDELIKNLFQFKLEAMMIFNKLLNLNQDTFNNSTYSSWFNNSLRNLESEISKKESKKCEDNINKSSNFCKSEITKYFSPIKEKILEGYYTSITTEEYIKDFEQ